MIPLIEFRINLQLFAEERTEPATAKRRHEVRQKGQVAKSRELVTAAMLLIAFFSLRYLSKYIFKDLTNAATRFLNFSKDIDSAFRVENLMNTLVYCMLVLVKVLGPILLIIAITIFIVDYLQIGFLFTLKPLKPSFSKMNPIEGFKRLFSRNSFVELIKSLFKIAIIGYVVFDYFLANYKIIPELIDMSIGSTVIFVGDTLIDIGIRAAAVLFVLSVIDYIYQRREFERNIRMSKQEIKEEYKQTEGNPQLKSKIREKQRQMALRRMMTEVPKSDVIITNPTHFAVAIKYDAVMSDAPIVIAKGKDLIAQKIKETAKEHQVPIVENKPLAQALYKSVEIGEKIPAELFKAVAEVLAFVYSLRER